MHESEGTHCGAAATSIWRQELGDHLERFRFGAAVRLDEGARGGAEPCAAYRIGDERQQRVVELAIGLHLQRGIVAEERIGNLPEVLHVRPEHDWFPEDCRLEDV